MVVLRPNRNIGHGKTVGPGRPPQREAAPPKAVGGWRSARDYNEEFHSAPCITRIYYSSTGNDGLKCPLLCIYVLQERDFYVGVSIPSSVDQRDEDRAQ